MDGQINLIEVNPKVIKRLASKELNNLLNSKVDTFATAISNPVNRTMERWNIVMFGAKIIGIPNIGILETFISNLEKCLDEDLIGWGTLQKISIMELALTSQNAEYLIFTHIGSKLSVSKLQEKYNYFVEEGAMTKSLLFGIPTLVNNRPSLDKINKDLEVELRELFEKISFNNIQAKIGDDIIPLKDIKLVNEDKPKLYIGTKIIKAVPMDKAVYDLEKKNDYNKEQITEFNQPGYQVVYEDGYTSWSPKDIFERCYREISESEIGMFEKLFKGNINKILNYDENIIDERHPKYKVLRLYENEVLLRNVKSYNTLTKEAICYKKSSEGRFLETDENGHLVTYSQILVNPTLKELGK